MTLQHLEPEAWEKLKTLFAATIELTPGERSAFVEMCNPALQKPLAQLLAQYAQTSEFMQSGLLSRDRVLEYLAAGSRTFSPGDVLADRFVIQRFIAEGGMGEVYEAEDRELAERVAIKTVRPALSLRPDLITAFKREIQLARRVTHSNVCRVFDVFWHVFEDGGTVAFLSMELLEGETLHEYLCSKGPIPFPSATILIGQIASALVCAHALEIVHRDLKPSNIMLVDAGRGQLKAVVTDFGLARSLQVEASDEFNRAGTPQYMSPEQINGENIRSQSDIYSLGLVICEVLIGEHPALDRYSKDKSESELRRWISRHHELDRRISHLIKKCLQFRQEDRIINAADIVLELQAMRPNKAKRILVSALVMAGLLGALILSLSESTDRVVDSKRVTPEGVISQEPSLSLDGKYLAYTSNRADPSNFDIWVQSTQDGSPRRLTTHGTHNEAPGISPDGSWIAFRSEVDGGGIHLIRADGTGEKAIIPGGRNPRFSPDGRTIAYWTGVPDSDNLSGQLYSFSMETGAVKRLAAEFKDARCPSWGTNGRVLLFYGVLETKRGTQTDFWTISPDVGSARTTGVYKMIQSQNILPYSSNEVVLQNNHLIFAARKDSKYQLWHTILSNTTLLASSPIRLLDSAEMDEASPTASSAGLLAREHISGQLNIWQIPLGNASPLSRLRKVTDGLEPEGCPAMTKDGANLFFVRPLADGPHLFKLDLLTGKESVFYRSRTPIYWPVPDSKGSRVAIESGTGEAPSILVLDASGIRQVCASCSHPLTWIVDGEVLLYKGLSGDYRLLDLATGKSQIALEPPPGAMLEDGDWNAASEYLALTVTRGGSRTAFAVKFPHLTRRSEGSWIRLTEDSDSVGHPRWSPDGRNLFYLARTDGYYCVWKKSFNIKTGNVGQPTVVQHFHDLGFSPELAYPSALDLSPGLNSLYLSVGKETSTISLGRISWKMAGIFSR